MNQNQVILMGKPVPAKYVKGYDMVYEMKKIGLGLVIVGIAVIGAIHPGVKA
jgi:hypothetical protein